MPNYCCVPFCHNVGGFKFPLDRNRREEWRVAVWRASWVPTKNSVVCAAHFRPEDFHGQETSDGIQRTVRRLLSTATPSVFKWTRPELSSTIGRKRRLKNHEEQRLLRQKSLNQVVVEDSDICVGESIVIDSTETGTPEKDILVEVPHANVGDDESDVEFLPPDFNKGLKLNSYNLNDTNNIKKGSQSDISDDSGKPKEINMVNEDIFCLPYICVKRIQHSDTLVHHYTGLESFKNFQFAFYSLGPNVNNLQYTYTKSCSVDPLECFLIMLVKLRCNYPVEELARMFSLSSFSISNIFYTWVKFCYCQWREINIWPSREIVNYFIPHDFKDKFPSTRVIIDGTEIPIQKPSNPKAQRATFSSYKHKNTSKILVGATPGGLVSLISDAYAGSTSDRQLTERSDLPTLCEPKDVIMADKGFNVQDIFAPNDVEINIPTFFKKKNRMDQKTVEKDRTISSKRVHIERIIGAAKKYKILCSPLNAKETLLSTEISFVCFMLLNFRSNIVSNSA